MSSGVEPNLTTYINGYIIKIRTDGLEYSDDDDDEVNSECHWDWLDYTKINSFEDEEYYYQNSVTRQTINTTVTSSQSTLTTVMISSSSASSEENQTPAPAPASAPASALIQDYQTRQRQHQYQHHEHDHRHPQSLVSHYQPSVSHPSRLISNTTNYTIVFDLDETLVSSLYEDTLKDNNYKINVRPYCLELLEALKRLNCEILCWSAGMVMHVDRVLKLIDPDRRLISGAVYRDNSWYRTLPTTKPLNLLKNSGKTLLIENSCDAAHGQLDQCIVVPSYEFGKNNYKEDTILLELRDILRFVVSNDVNS